MINDYSLIFKQKEKELKVLFNDFNRGYISEKQLINTLKYYVATTYHLKEILPDRAINTITMDIYYMYIDGLDKNILAKVR